MARHIADFWTHCARNRRNEYQYFVLCVRIQWIRDFRSPRFFYFKSGAQKDKICFPYDNFQCLLTDRTQSICDTVWSLLLGIIIVREVEIVVAINWHSKNELRTISETSARETWRKFAFSLEKRRECRRSSLKRNVRGRIVWKKEENAREEREREIDREREKE